MRIIWILAALSATYLLVILDINGTPIVLPTMAQSFTLSMTQMSWVINSYVLALACMVILLGKVADRLGLKRTFIIGNIIFLIGSFICGIATSFWMELLGRVIQGAGAAIIFPVGLAIVPQITKPEFVSKHMGFLVAFNAIVYAFGGSLAAIITHYISWRWFFYINIPLGIIAIFLLLWLCPRIKIMLKEKFDLLGNLLLAITIFCIVFFITEESNYGWQHPLIYIAIGIAVISFILFMLWEYFSNTHLINYQILRNRTFDSALISLMFWQGAILAIPYLLIFAQINWHFSPLKASLISIAIGIPAIISARANGSLVKALGEKNTMVIGFSLMLVGYLLVATLLPWGFLGTLAGYIILGLGSPITFTNGITIGLKSSEQKYHGVISGLFYASRYIGGTIIFSILTSLLNPASTRFLQQPHFSPSDMRVAMYFTSACVLVGLLLVIFGARTAIKPLK